MFDPPGEELDDYRRRLHEAVDALLDLAFDHATLLLAKRRAERQRDALARRLGLRFKAQQEATRLLELALHLRMHGENAPGGTETWRQFDREAEAFLRAQPGSQGCVWPEKACTGCATCVPLGNSPAPSYSPVRVPENTGKHPGESGETGQNRS